MSDFHCPECNASIEPDLIERTGQAECPFCRADLSALGLPEAEPAAVAVADDAVSLAAVTGQITRPLAELPAKSRITIVDSSPDRMVLYIPAGGKHATALGCFAVIWNGFMVVFTSAMIGGL